MVQSEWFTPLFTFGFSNAAFIFVISPVLCALPFHTEIKTYVEYYQKEGRVYFGFGDR